MLHDKWLTARLAYLRGLKAPGEQQRQLLSLVDKLRRTDADSRILAALIKVEAAAERAQRAKAEAARLAARDEEAARILEAITREAASREHDQELHNAAELLILAGLVDSETHVPVFDRGELLGALLGLANVPAEDPRRREWKRAGDALLDEKTK
ncbi:conjugative transfer protein TraD [Nitrosospira multiformis]|uniref:Conjugative transfer protein TraD n=1 Tax=Nitrosospira multiformis TaxID=1231 RepID=A0A2T5HZR4_9PROT|nr:conjugal transfer protein TraD [Nitrosospira multiformis]PTQ77076.1 conjugative transfer protein TraD [Nitrosospira multiformis]